MASKSHVFRIIVTQCHDDSRSIGRPFTAVNSSPACSAAIAKKHAPAAPHLPHRPSARSPMRRRSAALAIQRRAITHLSAPGTTLRRRWATPTPMISGSGLCAKRHRSQCATQRVPAPVAIPEAPAKARTAPTPPRQALRPLLRALAGVGRPRHRSTAVAGGCGHRHRFNAAAADGCHRQAAAYRQGSVPSPTAAAYLRRRRIDSLPHHRLAPHHPTTRVEAPALGSSKPAYTYTPGASWRSCSLAAVDRRATTRRCAFPAKPLISFNAPRPQPPAPAGVPNANRCNQGGRDG